MRLTILYFIPLLLFFSTTHAQGIFRVEIQLNNNFEEEKVRILIDNGKTEYPPLEKVKGNRIRISGPYFGEYAQITITYPRQHSENFLMNSTFFIKDKSAKIKFKPSNAADSLLDQYSLVNAWDFQKEKGEMSKYDSVALKTAESFTKKYGSQIFNDTTLEKKFFALDRAIYAKDLEYILANKDSYYAFSFFRRNYVRTPRISSDSILSILNTFPARFKNSQEAVFMRRLVKGRLAVRKDGQAPDFRTHDISGNPVSLAAYREKGHVLLNFWATWCGPCIDEMPALKEINDLYSPKGLTIISVAYPSKLEEYEKGIKEYNMDWINIYNDVDLINSYGGNKAIPRTYLIDQNGKILYDNQEALDDSRLLKLKKVLSKISKQQIFKEQSVL